MKTGWKKVLAFGLGMTLAAAALGGCSGKQEKASAVVTVNGTEAGSGVVNFLVRYQQAHVDSSIGSIYASIYGVDDIWSLDLTGSGVPYGEVLKDQITLDVQDMLLAEQHMEEYGVSLSDEEKAAISETTQAFVSANDADALKAMGTTEEDVERALTLYTIREKMRDPMSADVDTEVSDEEAAQTTVSYVAFNAEPETPEPETESVSEVEELLSEAEDLIEEAETAALEAETEIKTKASDETEVEAAEEAEESVYGEESTEAGTEAEETEVETESPEMVEARQKAIAKAQAFLVQATLVGGTEWEQLSADAAEKDGALTGQFTFGADSQDVDEAIIEAAAGLDDGAIINSVIESGTRYYIIHVDDAFDEEATEAKKEEIVEQRKADAITALFDEWAEASEISVDKDAVAAITFTDKFLVKETEPAVEAVEEDVTESVTESGTEQVAP